MSIHGSKKEELFKLILFHNPMIIGDLIGETIQSFEYEPYLNRRYIDLLGSTENSNLKVIVEVQLTVSDSDHFNRINEMFELYEDAIIIWIAADFEEEMMETIIYDLNFEFTKSLNFYAIRFDEDILGWINQLNTKNDHEKYREIIGFHSDLGLEIIDRTEVIPPGYEVEESAFDFELPHVRRNKMMLGMLYDKVPYAFNLLRSKTTLNRPSIHVGAGKSFLTYQLALSQSDSKEAHLSLLLTEPDSNDYFDAIANKVEEAKSLFPSSKVIVSKKKIDIIIEKQSKDEVTILIMADIFKLLHDIVSANIESRKII